MAHVANCHLFCWCGYARYEHVLERVLSRRADGILL